MRFIDRSYTAASLLLIGFGGHAFAQVTPNTVAGLESGGSGIVSPVTVASWIAHGEDSALDLLVLWRGTPAWFMRGKGVASGSTTSGTIGFGGLGLRFSFDRQAHSARIQDKEITLGDANVILVDRVDSREGPQVVGKLSIADASIDPPAPGSGVGLARVLRRSPELVSFLRCETEVSDPGVQALAGRTCSEVMEK